MNKSGMIVTVCALTVPSVSDASGALLSFYDGTLGSQHIGLTIQIPDSSQPDSKAPIEKASYFYAAHLHDIPLKIASREGLRLTLEEAEWTCRNRSPSPSSVRGSPEQSQCAVAENRPEESRT